MLEWFTDNQNVVRILQVGSCQASLTGGSLKGVQNMQRYNIRIEPEWVPREMNQLADYYSRVVDYDDWYINPTVFAMVDVWWGPHSIDRFATPYNKQVERFNSRYACPGTEAIDTFTVNWSGENNWWCPPPVLIPRVIRHAECCKA